MIKLKATIFAILAALLYAINVPFSKLLLSGVQPIFMASFLYLGAGVGIGIAYVIFGSRNNEKKEKNENLSKTDLPYTLGMIILDILAPIFLMIGLQTTSSANASLLNNFEIVATAIIALVVFKEAVSKRLWLAIFFIVISSVLLTVEDFSSLNFSKGSIFVILACVCWGFENNCTRMLSSKNTYEIVVLKGIFSGIGSFIVALLVGETLPNFTFILLTLILGFVAYGLSIFFYIKAQNGLGAAKTSAYYATSPFIGVVISFAIFKTAITVNFIIAVAVMCVGTILVVVDTFISSHTHSHTHVIHAKNGDKTIHHTHAHNHLLNVKGDNCHHHIHNKNYQ